MRTYIIILFSVWCCSPGNPYEGADASLTDGAPDGGSDTDTGENGDGGADSDADTDTDADSDGDTDTDGDTDSEFPNDSGPDSSGDTDTDADTDSDSDTDADSDSDEPVPCFATDGLCWALEPAPEPLTHEGAVEYCEGLGGGWRLPTVNEQRWWLAQGVPDDGCAISDPLYLAEWDAEDCTGGPPWEGPAGGCYWPTELGDGCGDVERSSSPRTDVVLIHWGLNFGNGSVVWNNDASPELVRCVRAD